VKKKAARVKQLEGEKADLAQETNELAAQMGSSQRELAIARGALATSTSYGKVTTLHCLFVPGRWGSGGL